jgi:formate hydrogenlyase transcriptional activator
LKEKLPEFMSAVPTNEVMTPVELLGAVLRASKAISSSGDRNHRVESFARELHSVVAFDYLFVGSCAEKAGEAKCVLEANGRRFEPAEFGMPLQESTGRWAHDNQQVLTIADWTREQRFPKMQEFLGGLGITSTCTLPLTRPDRRIGVLEFGSSRPNAYAQDVVAYLSVVADQIALAIDATVSFMSSEIAESRLKLLLELTNSVVSSLEFRDVLQAISSSVRRVMQCHGVSVALPDGSSQNLRILALDVPEGSVFKDLDTKVFPIEGSLVGKTFQTGTPVVANPADLPPEFPENPDFLENTEQEAAELREIKSLCFVPLISRNRTLGVLGLGKRQENGFGKGDLGFLTEVANQVAIAVENALAYREIADLKDKLAQEKLYLEDEIRGAADFQGIVGQSSALRHVLNLVETVAPSDSTVLLLGETGTGKELIARAIHDRSRRKDRTLVRLNCAAIPTGLLESELFGHEKGAFTGAISQKIGRLELADQGTLFLDEVGDIPIEIQPKLLRALQEREFERLGSTRTKKVDVRLVAATNRDLEIMIEDREFRSDLYYRLNVFPIRIPPLRERPEDIPLLVRYFTQKYGRLMNKDIQTIPAPAIKKLAAWSWPGNIRELENIIERSVILTRGSALHVPLEELVHARAVPLNGTREASERDDIVRILKATNGQVAGATGAAQRLGLPRTTLISRMKKLGIDPRRVS